MKKATGASLVRLPSIRSNRFLTHYFLNSSYILFSEVIMNRNGARRTRFHGLLLVTLWGILLLAGCGGGGGSASSTLSPKATIEGFSAALLDNNIAKAMDYMAEGSRDIYSLKFANVDNNARTILADALKNAREVSRSDNMIVYKATMKRPDNQIMEPTFILKLEKGLWKIDGI